MQRQASKLSKMRIKYHNQIAKEQRDRILSQRRKKLYEVDQFPLISDVLSRYWQISAKHLYKHYDQIFQTLDNINGEQLSQQQQLDLCEDLVYLFTYSNGELVIPYTFKFRKDDSIMTSTVAAYYSTNIDQDELKYWMKRMSDELKDMIYLKIYLEQSNQDSNWIYDEQLRHNMISDWGYVESAEYAIISFIQCDNIDLSHTGFIEEVFERLLEMNKDKKLTLSQQFFRIIFYLMEIYWNNNSNRQFSFLKLLLNQSLIKVYQLNPSSDLGRLFPSRMSLIYRLLYKNNDLILSEEAFKFMIQMLLSNYHSQFSNKQKDYLLEWGSEKKKDDQIIVKRQFICDLVQIALAYLRISTTLRNNFNISRQIVDQIKPLQGSKEKAYQNYKKLIQYNEWNISQFQRKNTQYKGFGQNKEKTNNNHRTNDIQI